MYVCAEGNTGRAFFFFQGLGGGEISRGIWGRWIWMGSLLLESIADREVNSSWPGEGRTGRGGGGRLMHALAYIWGRTPEPSLSSAVICSSSLRTICHYSFTLFCSCVVELLLSYHHVDLKKKPHTQTGLYYQCWESVGVCKLDFRLGSFLILAADAVCLRALKMQHRLKVKGRIVYVHLECQLLHRNSHETLSRLSLILHHPDSWNPP